MSGNFLTVSGSGFRSNRATDGAGIYTDQFINSVSGGALIGNHASANGGGIELAGTEDEDLTVSGTKITINSAATGGGGIYDHDSGAPVTTTVTDSAIFGNQPDNCEPFGTITGCRG